MIKKLPLKLTALIAIMLISAIGHAQERIQIGDLYYTLDPSNNTAAVFFRATDQNTTLVTSADVTVPKTVTYENTIYTVTSVGVNGFKSLQIYGKLTFPETVTEISDYGFYSTLVFSLQLPTLTRIGKGAFEDFSIPDELPPGMGSQTIDPLFITISGNNPSIAEGAFKYFNVGGSDATMTFEDGITEIPSNVFYRMGGQNPITIKFPSTLRSIESNAFRYSNIVIEGGALPEGLNSIGSSAFEGCDFTDIVIPGSKLSMGQLSMPSTLTSITLKSNFDTSLIQALYNVNKDCYVFVPAEFVDTYKEGLKNKTNLHVAVIGSIPDDTKIQISAPDGFTNFAKGSEVKLTADFIPAIPGDLDIEWSSSDDKIATVSNGTVTSNSIGTVTITARVYPDENDPKKVIEGSINLTFKDIKVEVTESPEILIPGKTVTLKATVSPENVSSNIRWSCNPLANANVIQGKDGSCNVELLKAGSVTIVASVVDVHNLTGEYELTGIPAVTKIEIESSQVNIEQGEKITLNAIVTPKEATQKVTWSCDPEYVAFFTDQTSGELIAKSDGEVKIIANATDGSGVKSEEYVINVTPVVSATGIAIEKPENTQIFIGNELELKAIPDPANATGKITWSSDNEESATVSASGVVKGISEGKATITVTITNKDQTTFSDEVTITVIPKVEDITLEAEGVENGKVTMITGKKLTLTATISPETATQTLSWTSENDEVATVNEEGEIEALTPGSAVITATATDGSGKSATIEVTVKQAVESIEITGADENQKILIGESITLQAVVYPNNAAQEVKWSSSPENIVSVDDQGKVTAIAAGVVTITVTAADGSGVSGSITLIVTEPVDATSITIDTPAKTELEAGQTLKLTAVTDPDDATGKITWKSDNTGIATVDDEGNVSALKEGTVEITASITNSDGTQIPSDPVSLIVTQPQNVQATYISVSPKSIKAAVGEKFTIEATVYPSNASTDVVWNVDDTSVCQRLYSSNQSATFTVLAEGKTTITATLTNGMALSASVNVTAYGTSGIDSINADAESGEVTIHDMTGRRLSRITQAGFYIVNGKKVFVR